MLCLDHVLPDALNAAKSMRMQSCHKYCLSLILNGLGKTLRETWMAGAPTTSLAVAIHEEGRMRAA
jgi:hypothetical protein